MILKENFELLPTKGCVLLVDEENPFIIPEESDMFIDRPDGTAYESQSEGSGQIVKLAQVIRFGRIVEVDEENDASYEVGDYVFFQSHAATLLPIGPENTVVRIPRPSILAKVKPKS